MVASECVLVAKLNDHVKKWRRFVDGTFVNTKRVRYNIFCLY